MAGSANSRQTRCCLVALACCCPALLADGTYATLGSYAITAVLGRADLAPTSWRLEGLEPGDPSRRQILDEVACIS